MSTTDASIQPGVVLLGKYRIERVLGQGGMGVVVAARHIELGELFAIKFLLPQALDNTHALERFLREARASARLKGEHIAKVHDVGRLETGAPYMVMEFLDGTDLKDIVRKRGGLPWEEAVAYVLQVSDAIAEAHALGIIHRDIKPANLFLIRRPNGTHCVKVLDFGISKQAVPEGVDLTKTGSMLGSPLYMSPEQMMRRKDVDARSDIWAMGVVLYELVTGSVPFPAETLTEVVGRVLQEEPVPPSQVRAGLPAELDAILAHCLQKRPENRFQRVEDIAAALTALLSASSASPMRLRTEPSARASASCIVAPPGPAMTVGPTKLALSEEHHPALVPVASTGSAWGNTGARIKPSRGGRVLVVAMVGGLAAITFVLGIVLYNKNSNINRFESSTVGEHAASLSPVALVSTETINSPQVVQSATQPVDRVPSLATAMSYSTATSASAPSSPIGATDPRHSTPRTVKSVPDSPYDNLDKRDTSKPAPVPSGAVNDPTGAEHPRVSFDDAAARYALQSAANSATSCGQRNNIIGGGRIRITFAPTGVVSSVVIIDSTLSGTDAGLCVSSIFRRVKVPPFDGGAVSVVRSFTIR